MSVARAIATAVRRLRFPVGQVSPSAHPSGGVVEHLWIEVVAGDRELPDVIEHFVERDDPEAMHPLMDHGGALADSERGPRRRWREQECRGLYERCVRGLRPASHERIFRG